VYVHPGGFEDLRARAWRAHRDGRLDGRAGHPTGRRRTAYGVGDYQDVSYEGQTACSEAKAVITLGTNDGQRHPTVGVRTVRLPHSTWRCTTIRRREIHGEIVSNHQITCTLLEPRGYRARVRFFYES
jgi:hypothetical protein